MAYRIDADGSVAIMPTPEAAATGGGYFQGGNPQTGTEATEVHADWLNMMQEEVVGVIEEAGLTLDKEDRTQLLQAIELLGGSARKYTHTQGVGNTTWTVAHNLNDINHIIQVFNASDVMIIPDSVTKGANSDTVTFFSSQTGHAIVIA